MGSHDAKVLFRIFSSENDPFWSGQIWRSKHVHVAPQISPLPSDDQLPSDFPSSSHPEFQSEAESKASEFLDMAWMRIKCTRWGAEAGQKRAEATKDVRHQRWSYFTNALPLALQSGLWLALLELSPMFISLFLCLPSFGLRPSGPVWLTFICDPCLPSSKHWMFFEAAPLHFIPELPLKSEHYNNALPLWRFYCKCSWLTQPEACSINWWVWLDAASALSFFPGRTLSDTGIRPAETPAQHLLIGQMWAADLLRFMNCESSGRITLAHCLSCWAQREFCHVGQSPSLECGQNSAREQKHDGFVHDLSMPVARSTDACTCIHVYMYIRVRVHMNACTGVHVNACINVSICIYMYICIQYIYMCVCVFACICIHVCTYLYQFNLGYRCMR